MSRSLTVPLLKKYAYNKYFLETGTYTGGGVQVAAYAGFEHIISIELDETYYNASSSLFKKAIKTHLKYADYIDIEETEQNVLLASNVLSDEKAVKIVRRHPKYRIEGE